MNFLKQILRDLSLKVNEPFHLIPKNAPNLDSLLKDTYCFDDNFNLKVKLGNVWVYEYSVGVLTDILTGDYIVLRERDLHLL